MKKLFSLAIIIVMILSNVSVFAQDGVEKGEFSDNIMWVLENGVLTISGTGAIAQFIDGDYKARQILRRD